MIVRLNTSWTVDPEKWADAAGMDPSRCLPELPWYISDAVSYIPMLDATDARLRYPGDDSFLPAELDGLVRFTMNWSIHVDADTWIRTRATGSGDRPHAEDCGYTSPVPAPHGRAHADCAQHVADMLYHLPMVIESEATMKLLAPFERTYTPGNWKRV
ncbi:hypothetical protein AB0H73_29855 [Streptomyces olivoreticuli]